MALKKFEGHEVIGTKVAITGAGDGLSQALAVEPLELMLGQTVYVVIECEVTAVTHDPVKDTKSVTRKHKLHAGAATLVDKELVAAVLDDQRQRIDAARGVERLDFTDEGGE